MRKRIVSMLLAFVMVLGMFPGHAVAAGEGSAGTVYLSISFDGKYIDDKDGNSIVYRAISLADISAVDLTKYGLDNMRYDGNGDGEYDITALQLIIYAHEKFYGGSWEDVSFDALPGSSYFKGGVFGFTENLVYFLNGDFPVDESQSSEWMTVGATSDRIVLKDGDFLDIASFTCYSFLWDQLGGFHLFADQNDNYVHDYTATAGEVLTVKVKHSFCDLMFGQSWVKDADNYEVYYGSTFGEAEGSVTTDDSGNAKITFTAAGTYYVWCDGASGSDDGTHGSCDHYNEYYEPCIVSSPAYAKVTVTGGEEPPSEPECEHNWLDATCEEPKTCSKCGATDGDPNGHNWSSGKCKTCKKVCEHASWEDGKCTVCTYACKHSTYENSLCTVCGKECPHTTWNEGVCKKCAKVCEHENWVPGKCEVCGTGCEHNWDDLTCTVCSIERTHVFIDGECIVCHKKGENEKVRDAQDASKILSDTLEQLTVNVPEPSFGTNAGEWTVFSLARGNYFAKDSKYFADYYSRIVGSVFLLASNLNKNGALDSNKSTENSRLIMALSSIGIDSTAVGEWDLVEAYSANGINWIKKQGINGTIWTLIALDSGNYETSDPTIRQQCVDSILSSQHTDGGWSLVTAKAQPSNVDITGMVLTALYPYRNQPEVAEACALAIAWLSESQRETGGFPYGADGETSESCAWAIVSLTMWGINPDTDPRFVKNGNSAVDNLLSYYIEEERMFAHQGTQSNAMATDQASYALVAYNRFINGQNALYDMTDVVITKSDEQVVHVESVALDSTEIFLEVGERIELNAIIAPDNASIKTVTWKSSDKKIANVANGLITAKAEGTATITVTTDDGSFTATCTVTVCNHEWSDGSEVCSKCGVTVCQAKGHSWVDATCITPKTCSVCDATEGTAYGHTDENGDNKCDRCTVGLCGENGHIEETVSGKSATCTEDGLTEGKKCSACGETLVKQEVIPATDHDMQESAAAVPATCETAGKTAVKTCANGCGKTEGGAEVAALGHSWTDATCTTPKTCSVCNATEGEAKGHNPVNGKCTVCGAECDSEQVREAQDVSDVLNATLEQLVASVPAPSFGTNAGEWTVFSLARGNYFAKDSKYFADYYTRILGSVFLNASSVNMNGALDKNKSTDNSRLIMALSSIGIDATSVGEWDLVEAYSANGINWIKKQGINGTIWALIALDSGNYATSDPTIRQQCIDSILSMRHDDGGWSLVTNKAQPSNVDVTGMALTALYPYRDQPEVAQACAEAIAWLSESQLETGGFPYGNSETSESCVWAIVSLTMWGINPDTDPRFIKNGKSAVDNLLSYYIEEERMFAHQGTQSNAMATDQASYALVAYSRFINGENALYDMSDVVITKSDEQVVHVENVTLDIAELFLAVGDTAQLNVIFTPDDATIQTVTWKSSDKKIANVANGKITAKAEGTATITVTTDDGSMTATCIVTVCDHEWIGETCTEPKTCSKCGFAEGEAKGHSWVNATCTTPKTCSVCATTEGEAKGHSWVDATCTTPKTCSVCDVIGGSALGHIDEDSDNMCDRCTVVLCEKDKHIEEIISGKSATCTESGLTDGIKCAACGEILVEQEVIPATGHDMKETTAAVAPGCESTGKEAVLTCANGCGKTEGGEEIPAQGHFWDVDGKCVVCGATRESEDKTITVTMRLIGAELAEQDVDLGLVAYLPNYVTWLTTTTFTLEEGALVYDLWVAATEYAGIRSTGAERNYVDTVWAPASLGGYDLSEFTNGYRSGWMYTINGSHPGYGLCEQSLKDGDVVVWHYVNDYAYEVEDWFDDMDYPALGDGTYWNLWLKAPDYFGGTGGGVDGSETPGETETPDEPENPNNEALDKREETDKEGNVIETVTYEDGSTTVTKTKPDGTSASKTTNAEGKVTEVKVTITEKAAKAEIVTIPVEITVAETSKEAVAVEIAVPETAQSVKVEIPVENVTVGTVIFIVDEKGNEKILPTAAMTEDGLAITVSGNVTVKVVDNTKKFVDDDMWAQDAIKFVTAREIFNGTGEDTFSPEQAMTRAMLMTVLARLDGVDTNGGATWYEIGMDWAKENGVSDGSNPNGNITREQLATMLYRYAGEPDTNGALNSFNDSDDVSSYAEKALKWAVENGIMNGMGDGSLNPKGEATRAQLAKILMYFINL